MLIFSSCLNLQRLYCTKMVMPLLCVYILFENFRWLLGGILIAAGDTFFMMLTGFFSVWIFMLLPTYLFVYVLKAHVIYAFWVWLFYSIFATLPIYLRYKSSGWKERARLISDIKESDEPAPMVSQNEES
ncbi:MAG: hypothetical protein EBS28_02685 [Chlamydiae bacterium]|nr:hypothetical protein [Chlamydiota bacterium]